MFASACFASASDKKRARERVTTLPSDSLPQTTPQAKNAAYCPTTTTCLVQTPVFFLVFFAFLFSFFLPSRTTSFLAPSWLSSCVSLQPVSSNPGDNHFSHALVGVFLRVLRPLSVLCDGWMLVRPLCVHDFGQETGVLIRQSPLLPLLYQQMP